MTSLWLNLKLLFICALMLESLFVEARSVDIYTDVMDAPLDESPNPLPAPLYSAENFQLGYNSHNLNKRFPQISLRSQYEPPPCRWKLCVKYI